MIKLLRNLLSFIFIINVNGNNEEKYLFDNLFVDYNTNVRPVINYSEPLEVQLGLGVQTIEGFNQMEETITLNIWQRIYWKDHQLTWTPQYSNLTFISLDPSGIWTPDLELLNAASLPEIYTLKGGLYLYSDGSIIYSRATILKFSCPLELSRFPFDTQSCTMNLSSWVYTDDMVHLIPNIDVTKQIDVLERFGHSEWNVINYSVSQLKEERACCKDRLFDVLSYTFSLRRFTHFYKISMGMTITLVIVSFIIMLMAPDNVSRTGTLVFIPLTILALQLTLTGKIPVVGYYTLMDYFFLLCFITSMMCSIESGLIYCLVTTKTPIFYDFMNRKFNLVLPDNDIVLDDNDIVLPDNAIVLDDNAIVLDDNSIVLDNIVLDDNDIVLDNIVLDDFDQVIDNLKSNMYRSKSYTEGLRNRNPNKLDEKIEIVSTKSYREQFLEDNNIQKVINYDDKKLSLTKEQLLIDKILNSKLQSIDNIYKILLPTIFFVLLIIIMSYEN